MSDAMDQLTGDFGYALGAGEGNRRNVVEFKRQLEEATFVRLKRSRTTGAVTDRIKRAEGIIRPRRGGKIQRVLFAKTLEGWFPQATARRHLTRFLRAQGVFREGRRKDTSTRQFHIAGIGRRCRAMWW
jgi:hypothetical protein